MNFNNKTAIVTGGTKGIGKAIADMLVERGCNVVVTGTMCKEDFNAMSRGRHFLSLDLLDESSLHTFISRINKLEGVDILINNAGINKIESIGDIDADTWEQIIKVNLTGPMLLMKHIVPKMKDRGGHILNISSIFGIVSKEMRASYSASKSGVIGLTRAAALDLAKYGLLVNALCPGFTLTDLTASILSQEQMAELALDIPLKRFADVSEIANVAVFLCSDLNTYITGQTITADGGFIIK